MPLGTIGLELCEKLQSQFLYPLEPTVMTKGSNYNPTLHQEVNHISLFRIKNLPAAGKSLYYTQLG